MKGPKALCQLQGYVYDAWLRMAEIFDELGKSDTAQTLRAKAKALFNSFNETFWDEDTGFYAYALDGDEKKVLTIASNPGHCLWSGIVPADWAGRVVRRWMAPDMWSGWGIRTLSADHPAYNPYSYQNGSVWPHDNGFIALGFRPYGFAAEAARVARDVSGAGGYFMQHQMPELYAGLERSPTNFPVQYLGANVPQAWAAGSAFFLRRFSASSRVRYQIEASTFTLCCRNGCPILRLWIFASGNEASMYTSGETGNKTQWELLKGDRDALCDYASGPALKTGDGAVLSSTA